MNEFAYNIVKFISLSLICITLFLFLFCVFIPQAKEVDLISKSDPEYCVVTKVAFVSSPFDTELRVYYDAVYDLEGKEKIVSKYLIVPDDAFYIYEAGMRFEKVTDIQTFAKDQVRCDDEKET